MVDDGKPAADAVAINSPKPRRAKPNVFSWEEEQQKRDIKMAELSLLLPDDQAGLFAVAYQAIAAGHAGVLAGDKEVCAEAWNRYEAAIWKLNGGTFMGCSDSARPDAGGILIERHCRACPGSVPMWGQHGEFLVERAGVRALVVFEGMRNFDHGHFQFHAVDLDGPFISETGYRSHFDNARPGMTVDQVASLVFAHFLETHRRYLEPSYQDRRADDPLPAWLDDLPCPPRRVKSVPEDTPVDADLVPPGFVLVDVVLPAYQAFMARKWARAAAPVVEAARSQLGLSGEGKGDVLKEEAREELDPPAANSEAKSPLMVPYSLPSWTIEPTEAFEVGTRCRVERVVWKTFLSELGTYIIVTRVHPETRIVWAHADKPITHRINARGNEVVDLDPRCIQSCYSMDNLTIHPQELKK